MSDGVPQLKANVVLCKCLEKTTSLEFYIIPSRYGIDYITLGCKNCGTQTRLCRSAKTAINLWNEHFGDKEKKHPAVWVFDGKWEQFL